MTNYDLFAEHYDAVMGKPVERAKLIESYIFKYHGKPKKVLEIACGTGSVLALLDKRYELSGLDLSQGMIDVAQKKIRKGTFYKRDMTSFSIDEKFDVIFCVFDSINHLVKFSDWEKTFKSVKNHLAPGGVFIFDINTEFKLASLTSGGLFTRKFGNNYIIMDISLLPKNVMNWNVRVFEKSSKSTYSMYEENIKEVSFSASRIRNSLDKYFSFVKVIDPKRTRPAKNSRMLYFVCKV
jgi:ubiquinone/menaquinone biosynthesis C-methylase UbiE